MGVKTKKFRSLPYWIGVIAIVCMLAAYTAIVRSMINDSPVSLLACMEVDARWRAWTCEQVLRHASLTKDHVRELNQAAGIRFPLSMKDLKRAEEILALFLARGVDINSRDQQTKGWTALHGAVMDEPTEKVAILLKHGARTDMRDEDGRTPLDLARMALQKHPADPHLVETIRLLEEAQQKSAS